jgi:cellulose biosynthesis protein BcsQ
MRICFANQKGGVGKTTATALVGAALHAAGKQVAFLDLDSQRTLTWWAEKGGSMPLADSKRVKPAVQYLLVDTPGALGPELEKGVAAADLIILVAEMGIASLHSTARTVPILRRAAPKARLAILFNKVRTNTLTGRQDPVELAKGLGAPALPIFIPLKASFELFVGQGWGALPGPDRELAAQIALCVVTA